MVVPTLNGGRLFGKLCRHLETLKDRMPLEVLIIDSGSSDRTVEWAREAGHRVHEIPGKDFGHGRTRNLGVEMTDGDVICFLTQDVLPVAPNWPLTFAEALTRPGMAGVYGRQVPRDANTMEMFFVALNYPATPLRFDPQAKGHHPRPGRVLFSNAFSAVRRQVMEKVPFPSQADFSEDQIWAYLALRKGFSILYDPRAEALHAHRYSMKGLFRRSRAVGRALAREGMAGGADLGESFRFLVEELRYFIKQGHIHRLPQLLPYEFLRWAGFQAGKRMGAPESRDPSGAEVA